MPIKFIRFNSDESGLHVHMINLSQVCDINFYGGDCFWVEYINGKKKQYAFHSEKDALNAFRYIENCMYSSRLITEV